jgi:hypothetical protein
MRWSHGAIVSFLISLLVVPAVLGVLAIAWGRAESARSLHDEAFRKELKQLPGSPNITNYGGESEDDDAIVARLERETQALKKLSRARAEQEERDSKQRVLALKVSVAVFGLLEIACCLFGIDALLRIRNNAGALRGLGLAIAALVIAAANVLVVALSVPVVLAGVTIFVNT